MPILISEEVAERKLNHPTNLLVKHGVVGAGNHNHRGEVGRPEGRLNISPAIKAMIGSLAMIEGPTKVGRAFGIAQGTVSDYKNGNTSNHKKDPKLVAALEENIGLVREKVINKILKHVDAITEEKIEEASLPILSKSASNLASIFDKFRDSNATNGILQQQFVFFGVKPRDEGQYNVIEVEASEV